MDKVWKEREDILKRVIDSIIIPKYPEIEGVNITSEFYRAVRRYVVVITTKNMDDENESEIRNDIKTLFKMSSLNTISRRNGRDYVDVFII
jgi:hypothetical protein